MFNEPVADPALVACPHCDLLQRLPTPSNHPNLAAGGSARCPRCDAELWRPRADSLNRTFALTLAARVLYAIANTFPMLGLSAVGHQASTTVLGAATLAFGSPSGIGQGGTGVLKVDGKVVDTEKMERPLPLILQWDEALDIGSDTGTPVDDADYKTPFAFTGTLEKITLTIDRPKLTPEDEKKLMQAAQAKKVSE